MIFSSFRFSLNQRHPQLSIGSIDCGRWGSIFVCVWNVTHAQDKNKVEGGAKVQISNTVRGCPKLKHVEKALI